MSRVLQPSQSQCPVCKGRIVDLSRPTKSIVAVCEKGHRHIATEVTWQTGAPHVQFGRRLDKPKKKKK